MRKSETIILTLATLVVMLSSAQADPLKPGSISGTILHQGTNDPVAGAWVAILETNQGATTDSRGVFVIEAVTPGNYTLIVSHPKLGDLTGLDLLKVTVESARESKIPQPILFGAQAKLPAELERKGDRLRMGEVATPRSELSQDGAGREQDAQESPKSSGQSSSVQQFNAPGLTDNLARRDKNKKSREEIYRCPPYPPQVWDDESSHARPDAMFFREYGTSGFISTSYDRFSTFAVDADDASYNLLKQYLTDGHLPDAASIRVEEIINHFDYGYNPPSDGQFRVFTELTPSPFDRNVTFLKIGVKSREIGKKQRQPINATFVIDVSGSMNRGNRFQLVREAAANFARQLKREDRVAIVAYGSRAFEVLSPIAGNQHKRVEQAMRSLQPGGSTYAEAGLKLGYQIANRMYAQGSTNMVVLFSDGVANVGQTSPDAIMNDVEQFAARGITLSSFGFGMGNYNDVLMEQLAQRGNGRYAYINNRDQVKTELSEKFLSATQLVARDAKIQVEFDQGTVSSYRLLGYENRDVPDHQFRNDNRDGGEVGFGHEVTALYELTLARHHKKGKVASIYVRWKNSGETQVTELKRDAVLRKHWQSAASLRPELRLAIAASKFGEVLKGTQYVNHVSLRDIAEFAAPLRSELSNDQTRNLLTLIQRAEDLGAGNSYDGYEDDPLANYKHQLR